MKEEIGEPRNECYSKNVEYPKEETESTEQTHDKTEEDEARKEEEHVSQLPKVPVKGTVKWEKRSSERVSRKPDS